MNYFIPSTSKRVGIGLNAVGAGLSGLGVGSAASDVQAGIEKAFDWHKFADQYNEAARRAAEEQRVWSAQQAQQQMDFQREMSDTQYQRAVKDMEAAGLNPYLLMTGGVSPAASPAGSMASSAAAEVYQQNDGLQMLLAILSFASGALSSATKLL